MARSAVARTDLRERTRAIVARSAIYAALAVLGLATPLRVDRVGPLSRFGRAARRVVLRLPLILVFWESRDEAGAAMDGRLGLPLLAGAKPWKAEGRRFRLAAVDKFSFLLALMF